MVVIRYATGSLLPLSTSSRDAVPYFRFSFLERRMENTDAASVEPRTAPIRRPSIQLVCRANRQNTPTPNAVRNTPSVDSSTDFPATGLAALHFVPKPP